MAPALHFARQMPAFQPALRSRSAKVRNCLATWGPGLGVGAHLFGQPRRLQL